MSAVPVDIHEILQRYWGYPAFRGEQEAIIRHVLEQKDTLAILPTGGGKSLCFQVPAMALEGCCLVITPLVALMKDQAETLQRRGIAAAVLHAALNHRQTIAILQQAAAGQLKFLYLSPERLRSQQLLEYLPGIVVSLIAVDEAHCISQWGYDFRPAYLSVADIRRYKPQAPVLALTASATPEVQNDICRELQLKSYKIFRQSFARHNLSLSVFDVPAKINKLYSVLQNVPGSSIVYCKSRRRTQDVARLLQQKNITAEAYHAGLSADEREARQTAWMKNELRVIVCTNAFGMGIDKPDVRTVIHIDVPDSLENYYQEAGRAGRDGQRAYAVLLYNKTDREVLAQLPETRFPPMQQIREVYQSLVNYLQVPSDYGEGQYYDFDIADFVQKFKTDTWLTVTVLKILEQENIVALNEQFFLPAQVMFVAGKEQVFDFEREQPVLEPLIRGLLRTYEGIYDQPVAIREKQLAFLLRSDLTKIKTQLATLHRYGIITYQPQKEKPQLYFPYNRVRAEDLYIDHEKYLQRKQRLQQRVQVLLQYIGLQADCRSRFVAQYFGDDEAGACGSCDNCLAQQRKTFMGDAFVQIERAVLQVLAARPAGIEELYALLRPVAKEKIAAVIDWLVSEERVLLNGAGKLEKK